MNTRQYNSLRYTKLKAIFLALSLLIFLSAESFAEEKSNLLSMVSFLFNNSSLNQPKYFVDYSSRQVVASVTVSPSGTIYTISGTNTPIDGSIIEFKPGALKSEKVISIAYISGEIKGLKRGASQGLTIELSVNEEPFFQFYEPVIITMPIPDGTESVLPVKVSKNDGRMQEIPLVRFDEEKKIYSFVLFHTGIFCTLKITDNNVNLINKASASASSYHPYSLKFNRKDGFKILNYGSDANPGGECAGFATFASWYYNHIGKDHSNLSDKYIYKIGKYSRPDKGIKDFDLLGQNIIVDRAHDAYQEIESSFLYNTKKLYDVWNWFDIKQAEFIRNTLNYLNKPVVIHADGDEGYHAIVVIGYDFDSKYNGTFTVYDPNTDKLETLKLKNSLFEPYSSDNYDNFAIAGSLDQLEERFYSILQDADKKFNSDDVEIDVTSHENNSSITEDNVTIHGTIATNYDFEKIELFVKVNDNDSGKAQLASDKTFTKPVVLTTGENSINFITKLINDEDINKFYNTVYIPNNYEVQPFILNSVDERDIVKVTLTWNSDADLDLYVIDPEGQHSSFFNKVSANGSELDYDDTDGEGPENCTIESNDKIIYSQDYIVRVHNFNDSNPTTQFSIRIQAWDFSKKKYNSKEYFGVLTESNSSNISYNDNGTDWSESFTFQLRQEDSPVFHSAMARKSTESIMRIDTNTEFIPTQYEAIRIKANTSKSK